jgi:hypothetical protein
MARLDWDRLRRIHPLDGADPRVDPDGAVLWEREMGPLPHNAPPGAGLSKLRAGIVVRRSRERSEGTGTDAREVAVAPPPPPRPASPFDASAWVECPRCRARIPRQKLLLHARASCTRRG